MDEGLLRTDSTDENTEEDDQDYSDLDKLLDKECPRCSLTRSEMMKENLSDRRMRKQTTFRNSSCPECTVMNKFESCPVCNTQNRETISICSRRESNPRESICSSRHGPGLKRLRCNYAEGVQSNRFSTCTDCDLINRRLNSDCKRLSSCGIVQNIDRQNRNSICTKPLCTFQCCGACTCDCLRGACCERAMNLCCQICCGSSCCCGFRRCHN